MDKNKIKFNMPEGYKEIQRENDGFRMPEGFEQLEREKKGFNMPENILELDRPMQQMRFTSELEPIEEKLSNGFNMIEDEEEVKRIKRRS